MLATNSITAATAADIHIWELVTIVDSGVTLHCSFTATAYTPGRLWNTGRLYENVEAAQAGGGMQASGACVNQGQVTGNFGKLEVTHRGLGFKAA